MRDSKVYLFFDQNSIYNGIDDDGDGLIDEYFGASYNSTGCSQDPSLSNFDLASGLLAI